MEKKHPLVIRTPEKINKDYTEAVINIGNIEIELSYMQERKNKMIDEQEKLMGKVRELSDEMSESQKHIQEQKEKEEKKTEETTSEAG